MNHLTKIGIKRFKSLLDFELPFSSGAFTCLIGLNGSGKSTVLHALDFIGQLFRKDVHRWFESRSWSPYDILTKMESQRIIEIFVEGIFQNSRVIWRSNYNVHLYRCTEEHFYIDNKEIFTLKDRKIFFNSEPSEPIKFEYEGSVFSQYSEARKNKIINNFFNFMKGIYSFDMINPVQLKKRSREKANNIGSGGEKLSGLLSSMSSDLRNSILNELSNFYPWIENFRIRTLRGGWRELYFKEKGIGNIQSQHSCDGLLRLIAVLAELQSNDNFIVFDEIENGFNPTIMPKLIKIFEDEKNKQIIATTHNPIILNYISEKFVHESIVLIYKDNNYNTKAIRYFSLPSVQDRHDFMRAGDIFMDVNLEESVRELISYRIEE